MNILETFKLNNRIAIVTGAGRGLGRAMSHGLAEAGADVVVVELDTDCSVHVHRPTFRRSRPGPRRRR